MKVPKDLRPLAKEAEAAGWDITGTRGGHLRWKSPDGSSIFTPSTPGDWRTAKNVRRKLRHAGLDV